MKKALYIIGLLFIALFLFITHSKFLHALDPGKDSKLFIVLGIDLKDYIPYIFGAAFGIVTTIIIALLNRTDKLFWLFVILTAILETLCVFLYNNTELTEKVWKWISAIYYGLYSGFIIIMYAYIKLKDSNYIIEKIEKEPIKQDELISEERNEQIIKLSHDGMKAKDIAKLYSLHIASVYRIINNNKNKDENEH